MFFGNVPSIKTIFQELSFLERQFYRFFRFRIGVSNDARLEVDGKHVLIDFSGNKSADSGDQSNRKGGFEKIHSPTARSRLKGRFSYLVLSDLSF